jgi:hypothetical protein
LVDVNPPVYELIHPMANRLRTEFLQFVEYGTDGANKPWFVMGVGSNFYSSGAGVDSFGTTIVQARPLQSTDELIPMMGGFRPVGDGVRQLDPGPLASGTHPLATSYEQFISIELFRVQALTEGARRSGTKLVTDSDADWTILRLLGTTAERNELESPDSILAEVLDDSFPFLSNVPVKDIVDLRLRLETQFNAFRGTLLKTSRVLLDESDVSVRRREARRLMLEEIHPRLSEYTAVVRATATDRFAGAALGIGGILFAAMLALMQQDLPSLSAAAATVKATTPYLERALNAQRELTRSEGDPMFFLAQLRKKSR